MSDGKLAPEDARALHAALVANRVHLDQLLWQAPVIAMTAQAFLLTIAYSSSVIPAYKVISGLLAVAIGVVVTLLFIRHAALEKRWCMKLEKFELDYFGQTIHERPEDFDFDDSCFGLANIKLRPIWVGALLLVSAAGICPIIEVALGSC